MMELSERQKLEKWIAMERPLWRILIDGGTVRILTNQYISEIGIIRILEDKFSLEWTEAMTHQQFGIVFNLKMKDQN